MEQRRMFGPKREEVGECRKLKQASFIIYTLLQILLR
jgi:hypothetical protein